jgi:hypothetical protein
VRGGNDARLTLARGGATPYVVVAAGTSGAERLAASELATYLGRIAGAPFRVAPAAGRAKPIVVRVAAPADTAAAARDGYTIAVRGDSLLLTGASPRAALYAAYDLLERLGCRWLAPALPFYRGAHEVVPRRATLVYDAPRDVAERPRLAWRKLDVEEGLSHDEASLRAIVAWMPKARLNTLQVPLDYGGTGRVRWDRWRAALAPELARRDLLIEVGGHGYQNFLRAEMPAPDGGTLFARHPEWFGRDARCRPSGDPRHVFATEHRDAVAHLVANVARWAAEHPEVDVLDFWPPDGVRWAECAADSTLGTPQDRQARLVNAVHDALRTARPGLRLEIIAYANAKLPPESVALDPGVLVDFCPIGQNFDVDIDDPAGANNRQYVEAIRAWRATHRGPLGLYAYYRRYAWRSLPVLLPRYIARDLRWWAAVPVQAASTYAEPGDWGTYELNHWAFARLAWNPDADAEALVDEFARLRYGHAAGAGAAALRALEDVVRVHGNVQYSAPQPPARVAAARARLDSAARALDAAVRALPAGAAAERGAAARLALMLGFARRDLAIQELRAAKAAPAAVRPLVEELVAFLGANRDAGTFLARAGDLARYLRGYGLGAAARAGSH